MSRGLDAPLTLASGFVEAMVEEAVWSISHNCDLVFAIQQLFFCARMAKDPCINSWGTFMHLNTRTPAAPHKYPAMRYRHPSLRHEMAVQIRVSNMEIPRDCLGKASPPFTIHHCKKNWGCIQVLQSFLSHCIPLTSELLVAWCILVLPTAR